jgi:methionyl-tRNA synthetase
MLQVTHVPTARFSGSRPSRFLADRFVEGTCPHCGADVRHIFQRNVYATHPLQDARGDQCDNCTRPLDPIELIKPRCLVDIKHTVTRRETAHMYVKLGDIQPREEEFLKKSWREGKWSPNAVVNADGEIVDERLRSGLRSSPITRDLKWGVPVPVDADDEDAMGGKVLCEYIALIVEKLLLIRCAQTSGYGNCA